MHSIMLPCPVKVAACVLLCMMCLLLGMYLERYAVLSLFPAVDVPASYIRRGPRSPKDYEAQAHLKQLYFCSSLHPLGFDKKVAVLRSMKQDLHVYTYADNDVVSHHVRGEGVWESYEISEVVWAMQRIVVPSTTGFKIPFHRHQRNVLGATEQLPDGSGDSVEGGGWDSEANGPRRLLVDDLHAHDDTQITAEFMADLDEEHLEAMQQLEEYKASALPRRRLSAHIESMFGSRLKEAAEDIATAIKLEASQHRYNLVKSASGQDRRGVSGIELTGDEEEKDDSANTVTERDLSWSSIQSGSAGKGGVLAEARAAESSGGILESVRHTFGGVYDSESSIRADRGEKTTEGKEVEGEDSADPDHMQEIDSQWYQTLDRFAAQTTEVAWVEGEQNLYREHVQRLRAARNRRHHPLFVDVGAQIGWFTLNLAYLGYEVVAFEAMRLNSEMLRSSLCVNGPSMAALVTLHTFGLGPRNDTCYLFSHIGNQGNGNTICGVSSAAEAEEKLASRNMATENRLKGKFTMRRMGDVLRREIQVLKMDVEGFEPNVLAGAEALFENHHVWFILTEFNGEFLRFQSPEYPRKFLSLLSVKLRYRISFGSFKGPFVGPAELDDLAATNQIRNLYCVHMDAIVL